MNDSIIQKTLDKLSEIIENKVCSGVDNGNIKVRMGKQIAIEILSHYNPVVISSNEMNSIFGYPIEIDYVDDMCLEVHTVDKVIIGEE